jgi:cytidylate kinase
VGGRSLNQITQMNKQLNISVVLVGRICSGKSYFGKPLSDATSVPIASFGKYLNHFSGINGLPADRNSLQNLGEKFVSTDHVNFLNEVIKYFIADTSNLIFDGVRHNKILDRIYEISNETICIFLDATQEIRFDRFNTRQKSSDARKSFEEFIKIDTHPVEMETESIRPRCNYILDSTINNSSLVESLLLRFKK